MSYLDVPRLHFFGTFTADPSTVNNVPMNYHLPPEYTTLEDSGQQDWNPKGTHDWIIQGCTVQSVIFTDGLVNPEDPLVNTPVSSAGTPPTSSCAVGPPRSQTNPKIVDLDTQQQQASTIYGLQITIGDPTSGTVTGSFLPQQFMDSFGTGASGGAYYQSELRNLQWSPDLPSPVLQTLKELSPTALSIKFNLVTTGSFGSSPMPMAGVISGTVGPVLPGELPNFLLGRLMRLPATSAPAGAGHAPPPPPSSDNPCNYAPFVVNSARGRVIVDFGNSFPMSFQPNSNTPNAAFTSASPLQVAIIPSQEFPSSPMNLENSQVLGTVVNTGMEFQTYAMIQEFEVNADQISQLQNSILGLFSGGSALLLEDEKASFLAVTPMVCRLDPGSQISIDLTALSFGLPAPNQTITVSIDSSPLESQQQAQQSAIPKALLPPIGVPTNVLVLNGQPSTTITTDANGQASFTICASPEGPGNPRGMVQGEVTDLDGQVYAIGFTWSLATNQDPMLFVSVHAYDLVNVPDSPDWEADVLPILQPYGALYPYMNSLIDLTDCQAVARAAEYIACRMSLPITDPRYMPVTRDLSANKQQIILNWLKQGAKCPSGG